MYTIKSAKLGAEVLNAINYGDKKEMIRAHSLIVDTKDGPREVIVARWYMGKSAHASQMLCSVWLFGKEYYSSGRGMVDGGGLHKPSAALDSALESANVELFDLDGERASIHGRGDSAIDAALEAIGRAMGFNGKNLIIRH